MGTATRSNYLNIQQAIANIIPGYFPGISAVFGDFTKIRQHTPQFIIGHAKLDSPTRDRFPQYEDLNWVFPLHLVFEYESDAKTHLMINQYRVNLLQMFEEHRRMDVFVDDGTGHAVPYPQMQSGHCLDSKIIGADLIMYLTLDEKAYALSTYTLWVRERVMVTG